jgi:starch synthase (maltosyl-transferring)
MHQTANGNFSSLRSSPLADLAARRIAIENVEPEIDGGRFAAKAVVGVPMQVSADIFSDGHEVLGAEVRHRADASESWTVVPLVHQENDRWVAAITFLEIGTHSFTIAAWRNAFGTWQRDAAKKAAAGVLRQVDIHEGLLLAESLLSERPDAADLAARIHQGSDPSEILLGSELADLAATGGPRLDKTLHEREISVVVDPVIAATGAWYELFPRSCGPDDQTHGTLRDVIDRLDYVRDLGFDVLYFPPIHPIGRAHRKGPNNSLTASETDPGSPYAIGSPDGGHDALHPELGTLEDFDALVEAAEARGLKIALDFAIQCSPDHPWIKDHPEWFDWRPDGTIKYAENPPKKYEDIVNVHFYGQALPDLWYALRDVVLFWINHGVTIFRVDNPHTKPFPFWEWMIGEVKARHPEVIFLSEAFTRPKVMKRLAKLGFSQSYSYFTWRNTKSELQTYLTELTTETCRHYMRPNFFANTPDINPYYLQENGRPGFQVRFVLAATLTGNYGIYSGYEICEAAPVPGKEEYLDSEKYQLRHRDFDAPGNIKDDIRAINALRHAHPHILEPEQLSFFNAFNPHVLSYGRHDRLTGDLFLFHVNLNAREPQDFEFEVPLWEFGLDDDGAVGVEDVLHGNRFIWQGKMHRLRLDPLEQPYAVWRLFSLDEVSA